MSKTSHRLYVPHCPSTFNCSAGFPASAAVAVLLPKRRLTGDQRAVCRVRRVEADKWARGGGGGGVVRVLSGSLALCK